MRRRFVTRSLVPLLALFFAGTAAAQNGTATVSGVVSDSSSKAPLQGAEVFIGADAGGRK